MSNLREQLKSQLACFDEEAFTALANRGLLRRAQKDLEKQTAAIVTETQDQIVMALGENRISFTAAGPAQAHCSCPAVGVCQHILAAAISLQRLDNDPQLESCAENEKEDPLALLHTALMHITTAELERYGGKASYKWAWQFVLDLDLESDLHITAQSNLVIRFAHPRMTFRYMGGDVASLVADVNIAQMEKWRVAAVLAYQRAQGAQITPPQQSVKARNASLDLGRDHAVPESMQVNQFDSRTRLRSSVKQVLVECIGLGLSHLSRGIYERFTTLAVWAQAAQYHRLALLLRRLADHVDLLLQRAGSADEERLFDEMTLAFALTCALEEAAVRQLEPAHLFGRARSQYEITGQLELLGLGASSWRSASGYLGLTLLFWSPKDQVFLSCTDARPENQRNFNPIARYNSAGPWAGLGAPAAATGRRVLLSAAQLNSSGRLSSAQSTSAFVQPDEPGDKFAQQLKPCKNWAELVRSHAAVRRSLLSEPQPMRDWVVLQPTQFGTAQFDTARQTLVWPLFDENNQLLQAQLVYSEHTAHAIERIEHLNSQQLPVGTLLVARLRSGQAGLVGEPLSLVRSDCKPGQNPIDCLYFDAAPDPGFASKWLNKFLQAGSDQSNTSPKFIPQANLPNCLRQLRHHLHKQAQRGVSDERTEQSLAELSAFAEKANTAGLTVFMRLISKQHSAATQLLQANYLGMQYEQLLESSANPEDISV